MRLPNAVVPLLDYPVDNIIAVMPPASSPLWDNAQFRQKSFDPHSVTRSIVFNWLDSSWEPGNPLVILRANYPPRDLTAAVSACADALIRRLNGGTVVKLMLVELTPGGVVQEHVDATPVLTCVHRCHVPVLTNQDVDFFVDGERYYLAAGIAYEFDNTRRHGVKNRSEMSRVHLICDIMPPHING
jgi:Aspartyl/Asparaginyl beta-hydroxylase